MAVKKKKKAKKRVRRFAIGGGTTTGTTITKDNKPSGGLGQGGQNSGSAAPSPSAAPSAPSPPSAGPTQNSPTPASGAPGAPGGISGLPSGNAESAFKQKEDSLKGSGIGGVTSIEKGPISSTQPPANYKATEVQDAVNQVNALRDVMQAQTQQLSSPFTKNMNETVRHIAGETGVRGIGAGEVANVMVNREISNATPGTPQYKNDLTDKNQWASIGNDAYKAAAPGSAVAGTVANEAIKGLMDGTAAPNATDFRGIKQKDGVTTKKTGVDVGGNRFGNFEGVSADKMADIRGLRGLSTTGVGSLSTPPSTEPSTENQVLAAGKGDLGTSLSEAVKPTMSVMSTPTGMPSDPVTGPVLDKNGFMSPQAKKATQYGADTLYSPDTLGNLYKDIGVYGIDDLDRKIAAEQALLGQTIGASQYGNEVTATANNKVRNSQSVKSIDPFEKGVTMHWAQEKNPFGISGIKGYHTTIDQAGNINYTKPFNRDGTFPGLNHQKGQNADYVGIASTGVQPNQAQVDAAGVLGRDWFNKDAKVTTHGYEAGTRIETGDRPRSEVDGTRQPAEGAALASSFVGSDTIRRDSWSPTTLSGKTSIASPEMSLAGREDELKNTTGLGALSSPEGLPPADPRNPIGGMSFTPGLPSIPRSAAGTYTSPYDPKRSASGTFTDSYNPEIQGPVRYGGNLDKIPSPDSTGMLPGDPRNPIGGMSFTPGLPERTLRPAAETYTSPYNPEVQGPVRYTSGLDSIPQPTGMTMVGPDSAFASDPRLNSPLGGYPAAPSAPAIPGTESDVPDQPGGVIGAYNGIGSLLSGANAAVQSGWKTISTPNKDFKKAAETYGPAHSLMGRIAGYDKQWDKQVSEGVKPAVDSLKQTLTRMQDNLRQAMSGPAPEDAQRGAETVKKAEGAKITDRLPGADTVQAGSAGQYTVSEPTDFGITLGDPEKQVTTAYRTDAEEFGRLSGMYDKYKADEDIKNYGPDVTGDEARKLAKEAGFSPNVRYNDDFLDDPKRLGITDGSVNPEDLSPVDMAKIHNRSMAKKYEKMDPNYLTKEEKELKIASEAAKTAVKKAPFGGTLMKVGEWWTEAEPVEDYLGRPSYEKEKLRSMGREADVKYGRRDPNPPNTTGTTTSNVTNSLNPDQQRDWPNGRNIPSPEDSEYPLYIWWYNTQKERARG